MASSNTIEQTYLFRSTITDSWYPTDSFARETESALTKALQQSFFTTQQQSQINSSPYFYNHTEYSTTTTTVTASGSGSGSEPETPGSKRRNSNNNSNLGVSVAKPPTKRKSRASKRSMTTFIQADPANFRQMVQQVTGGKMEGTGQLPVSTVVKPEPQRQALVTKLQGLLPTLDTSAYLLHRQDNGSGRIPVNGSTSSQLPAMNQLTGSSGVGVDFYSFSGFPTLESSF